jgi:hypothetical protein
MKLREKVVVEGLPYIWSTNLDDDGIREFFELHADQIREPDPPIQKSSEDKLVINIPIRLGFLDFREGVCL